MKTTATMNVVQTDSVEVLYYREREKNDNPFHFFSAKYLFFYTGFGERIAMQRQWCCKYAVTLNKYDFYTYHFADVILKYPYQ